MQELIQSLNTRGDIISFGIVITIEGMLVVFAILILIMLAIQAMSFFTKTNPQKAKTVEQVVPEEAPLSENTVDENELIAVLTAAVAACMDTTVSSVNIRSYKKVASAWCNAAKREVLDNKF